jgi:hypothetical protein
MATGLYSTRFVAVQGFDGTLDYEVPSGFVAVLRDVDVYASVDAFSGPAHLRVLNIENGTIWLTQIDTDTSGSAQWRGRQVFNPTERIRFLTDAPYDITASGYLLTV